MHICAHSSVKLPGLLIKMWKVLSVGRNGLDAGSVSQLTVANVPHLVVSRYPFKIYDGRVYVLMPSACQPIPSACKRIIPPFFQVGRYGKVCPPDKRFSNAEAIHPTSESIAEDLSNGFHAAAFNSPESAPTRTEPFCA